MMLHRSCFENKEFLFELVATEYININFVKTACLFPVLSLICIPNVI